MADEGSLNNCEVAETSTASSSSKISHVVGVLCGLNSQRKNRTDLCDVQLITEDGTLYSHKGVLVTCSKYFEAMFSHEGMKENIEGKVNLFQFNTEVMESLLNFIYSGNIEISTKSVQETLMAAHYLQIDGLVETCCEFILQSLSEDNYVDFLNEVARYFLRDTEAAIRTYIEKNICREFAQKTEAQFQKLTYEQLHSFLATDKNLPNMSGEYEIFELAILWLDNATTMESRHEYVARLLNECVRYPMIPLENLTDRVLPYISDINDSNLFKAVIDAQTYHLRQDRQSSKVGTKQTTLRFTKDCIMTLPVAGARCLRIWQHPIENSNYVWTSKSPDGICPKAAIAELDGFVYVAGGKLSNNTGSASLYRYNPNTNKWFECQNMNQGRFSFSLTGLCGKLYAVAGLTNGSTSTKTQEVESYDPHTNKWSKCCRVVGPTYNHAAVGIDKTLYIAGGERGTIQRYDVIKDKWECLTEDACFAQAYVCGMYNIKNVLYILHVATPESPIFSKNYIDLFSVSNNECLTPSFRDNIRPTSQNISSYIEKDTLRIIVQDRCGDKSYYVLEIDGTTKKLTESLISGFKEKKLQLMHSCKIRVAKHIVY